MCDIPIFDPYVKLMEEWRDFQWRMYLLMLKDKKESWQSVYWHRTHNFELAVKILKDMVPVRKDERLDEFKHLKYGQYPDNWNVPEMD